VDFSLGLFGGFSSIGMILSNPAVAAFFFLSTVSFKMSLLIAENEFS
jgi:hypothetical protein